MSRTDSWTTPQNKSIWDRIYNNILSDTCKIILAIFHANNKATFAQKRAIKINKSFDENSLMYSISLWKKYIKNIQSEELFKLIYIHIKQKLMADINF